MVEDAQRATAERKAHLDAHAVDVRLCKLWVEAQYHLLSLNVDCPALPALRVARQLDPHSVATQDRRPLLGQPVDDQNEVAARAAQDGALLLDQVEGCEVGVQLDLLRPQKILEVPTVPRHRLVSGCGHHLLLALLEHRGHVLRIFKQQLLPPAIQGVRSQPRPLFDPPRLRQLRRC